MAMLGSGALDVAVANSATKQNCPSPEECDRLNQEVQAAKQLLEDWADAVPGCLATS
jgi:hypothetical protein